MSLADSAIRDEIVRQIGAEKTVAPRDIAQALAKDDEDWRRLLPRVREQAIGLYQEGELQFIRKRKPVSPDGLRGLYRLARPAAES